MHEIWQLAPISPAWRFVCWLWQKPGPGTYTAQHTQSEASFGIHLAKWIGELECSFLAEQLQILSKRFVAGFVNSSPEASEDVAT